MTAPFLARASMWAGALAIPVALLAAGDRPILSLDGRALPPPAIGEEFRERQEALLAEAEVARDLAPHEAEGWIWVGRRQAYLGRYQDAIETFSEGNRRFPADVRFLRHRGHRWITVRRLDEAITDLRLAADRVAGLPDVVELDGLPNELGIPTSTLKTNIWYHLGLAHYLRGEFRSAAEAYTRCSALAANQDMRVAADYWLYLSLRRTGEEAAAQRLLDQVPDDLEIIENGAYYELLGLFAGRVTPDQLLAAADDRGAVAFPTRAYGLGVASLLDGRADEARATFESIVASPAWAAFGSIAAEAELARLEGRDSETHGG